MSSPSEFLFGDGGEIVVPTPKRKQITASEPVVIEVNTERRFTLSQPGDKDVEDADAATNTAKLEKLVGFIIQNLASRGYTLDRLGPNPCSWPSSKVFLSFEDQPLDATKCLPDLPNELVGEISSGLSIKDLNNMRLVNKRFYTALNFQYGKTTLVTENATIYPTFASISSFLIGLSFDSAYPGTVREITLVGEGPMTPEMSYDISWGHLMRNHSVKEVDRSKYSWDTKAINEVLLNNSHIQEDVNHMHAEWDYINKPFCHTGTYRIMLSILLSRLPNLKTITTRKLHVGEHIPGWIGPKYLKDLSFYKPDLPINEIYYGDWQYDTLHKRITMYIDEYGEYIEDGPPGLQAGFMEDVNAAMRMSGTQAVLV